MEVPEQLVENWFYDIQKKKVDPVQRAEIISLYIKEKKISQREFSRQFNIPKSNTEDWLLWKRLTKEDYENLLAKGYEKKEIYRLLRNNKKKQVEQIFDLETNLDLFLFKFSRRIQEMSKELPPKSKKTISMIEEAKKALTRIEIHYK
jgi:hypothetical protein